jgi:hypothetical protein
MEWYTFINIIILSITAFLAYYGPIRAVQVGRKLNDEQKKDDAKRHLFLTLFAQRGSPINKAFVDSLNQIDIVFSDTPAVLQAWASYYQSVNQRDLVDSEKTWQLLRTDLLSEMAVSLGYRQLKQTDILKHYIPEGHNNMYLSDLEIRENLALWLKSSNHLNGLLIGEYEQPSKQVT